ncbi:hypothetical protein NKJ23_27510 [Mesorhizobium sp. M0184]|uniref:hypothetical protein n=1 Tax=Mesorhizobium sp. M0184 TaxID=2956906 RepID=UPI0033379D13
MADIFGVLLPSLLTDYRNAHGLVDVPIKADLLRPLIEQRGVVDRILWEEFDYDSQTVLAKVEFYRGHLGVYAGKGDYARVQYNSSLNFCWQRFVLVKEMCHCLIDDTAASRVVDMENLMKLGQMLVAPTYASLEDFPPHVSEHMAEIVAVETLFPIELRSHHKAAYDDGTVTDYQLALRYRIPEQYVRFAMLKGYYETIYSLRASNLVDL